MRRIFAIQPWRLDSYIDLDAVRTPVQVLTGTADLIIEDLRQGQVLADRLSDAAVMRLAGSGHMLHHSRPDALLSAVQAALERGGGVMDSSLDSRARSSGRPQTERLGCDPPFRMETLKERLMSEQDPKQSAGANAGSPNDAGGAASEAATARTAEFLERGAELAKLGAQNMEAFVASAKVAGRAAESLTPEVTEYQRKTFEDAFAMAGSFATVRSPADVLPVQSQFAKAAFENAMAFPNNMSGTLTKVAGEAVEPSKPSPSADSPGSNER